MEAAPKQDLFHLGDASHSLPPAVRNKQTNKPISPCDQKHRPLGRPPWTARLLSDLQGGLIPWKNAGHRHRKATENWARRWPPGRWLGEARNKLTLWASHSPGLHTCPLAGGYMLMLSMSPQLKGVGFQEHRRVLGGRRGESTRVGISMPRRALP